MAIHVPQDHADGSARREQLVLRIEFFALDGGRNMKYAFKLLIVICIITGTSWAADDPFAGKWKLDSSQSELPADTMKVKLVGANKYTFIFSEPNAETIATDGTDQPGISETTLSVTAQGPRVWEVVRKRKGRTLLRAIWTLSEDDKTLHDAFTEYRPDGSPFTVDYLYLRKAGESGFAGTWQSTSEVYVSPYEIQIVPYQGDGFSLIDTVAGVDKSLKFDGKDYPNSGPNANPDMLSSGRRISDRRLELTDKLKGRVQSTDDFELSPDLQTLTETQHLPDGGKPIIFVFKRE
jgi:hypothetical protein